MREGIQWQHVEYFNNKIICDLVEQQHKGILSILDEACLSVGKVTDEVGLFMVMCCMRKRFSHLFTVNISYFINAVSLS